MSWLYRYETKGIQRWILDSNQLRDLAGGSTLIENLTVKARQWAEEAGASRIIQATSGAMTAEFPDDASLARFAGLWPLAVSQLAPGLTLVQAWVEQEQGLAALFEKLAARRNNLPVMGVEAGPWVLRTGRSGEPAVPTPRSIRSAARQTTLDAASLVKERAYLEMRGKSDVVTGGHPWSDFQADIDQWPDAPVAVLHADGSGIGQALLALGGEPARLQRFSTALKEVTAEAIRLAVESLPRDRRGLIVGRPVVSAGDDLTYIVPASAARIFCRTWLQAFETGSKSRPDELGGALTAGAGAVVVHRHFPFSQAYEMAETLCSQAKRAVTASGERSSVLALSRITTSLDDEHTTSALAWRVQPDAGIDPLESLIKAVKRLPRGTLRTWLTAFDAKDDAVAEQFWTRGREVAEASAWEEFESALQAVGANPADGALTGRSVALELDATSRATPLRDALTLARLERERA